MDGFANTNVTLKKQLSTQQKTNNSSTFLHLSISVNNSNALKILLENKLGGDITGWRICHGQ